MRRESEPAYQINIKSGPDQEIRNLTWCWGPILLTSKVSATSCNLQSIISIYPNHFWILGTWRPPFRFLQLFIKNLMSYICGKMSVTHFNNIKLMLGMCLKRYLWKVDVEGLKELCFALRQVHIGQQTMEYIEKRTIKISDRSLVIWSYRYCMGRFWVRGLSL